MSIVLVRAASVLVLVLLGPIQPTHAQFLDPDITWDDDQWSHMAAGGALDIVVRGPYIAESWRKSFWRRVGLVMVVGVAYEGLQWYEARQSGMLGQPGYGFGLLDLAADALGAIAVEGGIFLVRRTLGP